MAARSDLETIDIVLDSPLTSLHGREAKAVIHSCFCCRIEA